MSILVGALPNQGRTGGRSGLVDITAVFTAMLSTSTMLGSAAIRSGTALPSVWGISPFRCTCRSSSVSKMPSGVPQWVLTDLLDGAALEPVRAVS
jgi:hypothetical protein